MKHHGEKRRVGFSHHTAPAATAAKRDNCAISSPLPSLRDTFPRKRGKGMICAFHHYPRSYIAWQILPLTRCGGLKHPHPVFFAVSAHSSRPSPHESEKSPALRLRSPLATAWKIPSPVYGGRWHEVPEGGDKNRKRARHISFLHKPMTVTSQNDHARKH